MRTDAISASLLPRYRRRTRSFEDLFGAPAAAVLASMDAAGDDVPSRPPRQALDIEAVGLRRRDVLLTIADPFETVDTIQAICTVDVAARVPRTHRGVHMSRIGHAIAETVGIVHRDLAAYAETIADRVADSQYGAATVTVHARIPYVEEVQADRSSQRKLSLEHLHVVARQTVRGSERSRDIGLQVTHMVACPCVQETYRHAGYATAGAADREAGETGSASSPARGLMTHSQRCCTRLMANAVREDRSVLAMLRKLDEVLVRTCNTLPRDAELACVYRAHVEAQFIEDALRAAVMAMADVWSPAGCRGITGRSRTLESIHEHDLTAALRVSTSALRPHA
jgi:GTP cyclohydrolase FolE2